MIEFLSGWVKGIGVAIIIITIMEMLLPNNKTKKYIQMLFGIFIIFNIVAPLVENKNIFDVNNFELDKYKTAEVSSQVNSVSIDERVLKLYEEELKENIENNLKESGYEVISCNVVIGIKNEEEYEIRKIALNVKKEETAESKLVKEIEKIKKVDININEKVEEKEKTELSEADIRKVQKILMEEYGVNEKCLEIS